MIVLAIAGLILAIVFIAVPALQRNSRNTQRRADLGNLRAQVDTWVSNNGGKIPNDSTDLDSIVGSTGWGHYNGNITEPTVASAFPTTGTATTENTAANAIYMFGKNVTPITGAGYPNQNAIHIWLERECIAGGVLTSGHDDDVAIGTLTTGTKYATGDLLVSNARAIAFIYQIEGEDKARCEDNV